ncbi:unnamed protein product, partial [Allacma fusca]
MKLSFPKKFTLRSDPKTFGQIHSVEGKTFVEHSSNGCKVVPATDGSVFPACDCKNSVDNSYNVKACLPSGAVDIKSCQQSKAKASDFSKAYPKYHKLKQSYILNCIS